MKINGHCFVCDTEASKTVIKKHILKEHNQGEEKCYLIKAEGFHNKNYWLYFSVPLDTTFKVLDTFLRKIWCECCGHLSQFTVHDIEVRLNEKLSNYEPLTKIKYEYDFGSTTDVILIVVDKISRVKQKTKVQLLARNNYHQQKCEFCNKLAHYVDRYNQIFVCENCLDKVEEEYALIEITNSPRCGKCGYDGILDKWKQFK